MELSPRWRKLAGDLRNARGRLSMMVLAMAVGMFGIAAILSAYTILTREIGRNYLGTNPASALIEVDQVTDELVDAVRHRPGIANAESGTSLWARVEVKPDEWMPLLLFVVKDFRAMKIGMVRPESGAYPPPEGSMLLERTGLPLVNGKFGDGIRVQTPNGPKRKIVISGLVHDPGLAPSWQEQTAYGYITLSTLALLGESGTLDTLKVTVSDPSPNVVAIERTVAGLAGWLRQQGYSVGEIRIPPPGKHPHETQMRAVLAMLILFSLMALVLSAVLTASTIGGMLAQQVRQIGIMKAIGARSSQIAGIYLALVVLMGGVAVVLGLPPGIAAGRGLARAIAELLNLTLYSEAVPGWVYLVQLIAGLLVPFLIALGPILRATRITVREAINDYGTSIRTFRSSRLDALLGKIRGMDRTLLLSIRNTFRRRGRLMLTLGLLSAAGAMFMTALNVRAAWERNLADAASDRRYDLEIRLNGPHPEEKVLAIVSSVPGVQKVESWDIDPAAANRHDGLEIARTYPDRGHGSFTLRSAPPGSRMIQLTMLGGRWLPPGDSDAVVLNHMALRIFPGVKVGDTIHISVQGRQTAFHVVGIAREIVTPAAAYTSPEGFHRALGRSGQTNAVRVVMKGHDEKTIGAVTREIERALERERISVKIDFSETRLDNALSGHIYILIFALILMSAIMAVVGVLGLASAMGTTVVERTREFGVMRAIGGRTGTVMRNVIGEGVFIGLMSWGIAIVLSLPLSAGVGRLVGTLAFYFPLPLVLSPAAMIIWLTVIFLGSTAASAYPASRASRLTVRETLAYT
ncbi:MAG: FtsX-like permease family protein [Deltaproteobacteria bacterium]|nr:FtsX-like permease family protein [Deltaproteobacteria bacterium]